MAMRKTGKTAARKSATTKTKAGRKAPAKASKSKATEPATRKIPSRKISAKAAPRKVAKSAAASKRATRAPKKAVAKKTAAKVVAKKPAAKVIAKKPVPATSAMNQRPSVTRSATTTQRKPDNTAAAKAASQHPQATAKPGPKKRENLSPEARKKLAAQHLWELVEQKKRLAAQTPPWQQIEHHDHPAPPVVPDPLPLPKV